MPILGFGALGVGEGSCDQDEFSSYLHVVGKRGEPGKAGQFVIEDWMRSEVEGLLVSERDIGP